MTNQWKNELAAVADEKKIKILSSFFKTGKGEYGEGDVFIGIKVPDNRAVAKKFFDAPYDVIELMLRSEIHEHRLSALLALAERYRKTKDDESRREILDFYLSHTDRINNWDLVDLSAPQIVGEHQLRHPDPELLDRLSMSGHIWTQRIAIVATYTLIKHRQLDDTYRLAERYLSHPHPLIHKATGWMLRETGKRDEERLRRFLDRYATTMPRTALRYAIERLSPELRAHYMGR